MDLFTSLLHYNVASASSLVELILLFNSGDVESLTTATTLTLQIAVSVTAVVVFIAGVLVGILAGVLLYHCIIKHQAWSCKPESSSHQQQQTVPSSNTLQRTGPQYEDVMELRQNAAYEPTQTGIEMKPNEAYGPI